MLIVLSEHKYKKACSFLPTVVLFISETVRLNGLQPELETGLINSS